VRVTAESDAGAIAALFVSIVLVVVVVVTVSLFTVALVPLLSLQATSEAAAHAITMILFIFSFLLTRQCSGRHCCKLWKSYESFMPENAVLPFTNSNAVNVEAHLREIACR
jgi:hypothetical protein